MQLTKAEAELLLPIGCTEFAGSRAELCEEIVNTYNMWEDAPLPPRQRAHARDTLSKLAHKMGFELD